MYKFTNPFINSLYTNRYGLLAFACLSLLTVLAVAMTPSAATPVQQTGAIDILTKLSQTKLVQGEMHTVYLDVSLKPPSTELTHSGQRASDIIVVLDRSGSMAGANKMPYAKAAIRDLLSRLNEHDRFALVSFANNARVHSPLTKLGPGQHEKLMATLNNIHTGGGTNIEEGLHRAVRLLDNNKNRASKVLLLSDGQANQGVSDLTGLSHIVAQLTQQESVLSSIGMGLDFNETLMSSLADYGMGTYSYLENLSGLENLFAHSLNATRNIYAAGSLLNLKLSDGVTLIDAGGYPINKNSNNQYTIKTGQLLGNNTKKFIMTFQVSTQEKGNTSLGNLTLTYQSQGKKLQQSVLPEQLSLAVVEPEKRQEAISSIDEQVYKQSWLKNNLGRMQKNLSYWVRQGNKDKADQVINEYREDIAKAEKQAAMPIASEEMDAQLNDMESNVADAFSGDRLEQEVKRKRAAKSMQLGSIKEQRENQ